MYIFCAGSQMSCELWASWHGAHSLCTWAGGEAAQHLHIDLGGICRRAKWCMCKKKGKHTPKTWSWEAKRVIFKMPLVNNTQRGQLQGLQLQWSYWPILNLCGGPVRLGSSSLPRSVMTASTSSLFKKVLNWGVKIPTRMPLLSATSSQHHPELLAAVAGTTQHPGINKRPLLSLHAAFKHKGRQVTP